MIEPEPRVFGDLLGVKLLDSLGLPQNAIPNGPKEALGVLEDEGKDMEDSSRLERKMFFHGREGDPNQSNSLSYSNLYNELF